MASIAEQSAVIGNKVGGKPCQYYLQLSDEQHLGDGGTSTSSSINRLPASSETPSLPMQEQRPSPQPAQPANAKGFKLGWLGRCFSLSVGEPLTTHQYTFSNPASQPSKPPTAASSPLSGSLSFLFRRSSGTHNAPRCSSKGLAYIPAPSSPNSGFEKLSMLADDSVCAASFTDMVRISMSNPSADSGASLEGVPHIQCLDGASQAFPEIIVADIRDATGGDAIAFMTQSDSQPVGYQKGRSSGSSILLSIPADMHEHSSPFSNNHDDDKLMDPCQASSAMPLPDAELLHALQLITSPSRNDDALFGLFPPKITDSFGRAVSTCTEFSEFTMCSPSTNPSPRPSEVARMFCIANELKLGMRESKTEIQC